MITNEDYRMCNFIMINNKLGRHKGAKQKTKQYNTVKAAASY
jgi:hypothetical protein